jgi:Holliday junction DNA helicase RuvA
MFDSIQGRLVHKDPTTGVVDVSGLRFRLHLTVSTYEKLPSVGDTVELLTYLHVREDILELYAFHSQEERDLFLLLNTISGIGPRSAMTILSGTNPAEFKRRIVSGDVKSLTIIPGIGPKTAKRIIVELKEHFVEAEAEEIGIALPEEMHDLASDAIHALMALGFKRGPIHQVLRQLEHKGELTGSIEDIIKKALQLL